VAEALEMAGDGPVAVIGGAEIYALFLPLAEWIELTEVHGTYTGDTVMPPLGPEWREVEREEHPAEDDRPAYAFVTLRRSL
jgi:dihydrofolate reductase